MSKLKRIIYIDDQTDILLIAEYALTQVGNYHAQMCEGGAQALEKIEQFNPDIILLDVMMPGLDGPETLSRIRKIKSFESTPAIFITAKIFPKEVEELRSCDDAVIGVIAKPFDPLLLSETVQSEWDSWLAKICKKPEDV